MKEEGKELPESSDSSRKKRNNEGEGVIKGRIVGRDKKVIPPREVQKLASMGCKDTEISDFFGVDPNTLRYNFKTELLMGRENLKQKLRQKQIEVALNGNVTMLIFLGKNLLGQSDSPMSSEHSDVLPWSD